MCMDSAKSVQSEANGKHLKSTKKPPADASPEMEEPVNDGLRIRRIAGESLMRCRPLFSPDGNLLFVIHESSIQAFSANTGEFVRSYENTVNDSHLVGMVVEQHTESKYIYACTVDGLILSWKIGSGVFHEKFEVQKVQHFTVQSFHALYGQNDSFTFVLYGTSTRRLFVQYCPHTRTVLEVINASVIGDEVTDEQEVRIVMAPGGRGLNYFAYIAGCRWYWVTLRRKPYVDSRPHCSRVQPVLLDCHPTESIVAIGDTLGRVVLYRNFLESPKPIFETYHWHPHPVQCLAFSSSGTHFYSGGHERVLIKWKIGEHKKMDIIPRLTDSVVHVAVAPENLKVALCTADNSIQLLNALNKPIATVQSFSKISNDVPGATLFPVGLRTNPRTQAIVLNGRVGCIQFYSTYTNSLLYTLDITLRNYNTNEDRSVIYNTVVTNVAVSAHWLATVEHWNDHNNSNETRLKFWKYDDSRQTYSLSTNIENVHLGGVCGAEFSSASRERDAHCATAGTCDRRIKLWAVEEIPTTGGGGEKLVWICVGIVQHRDLPIRSISFSQDGSLLAAGCGNVLCAWNTDTLQLKCALSAPGGYDGCVNRAVVVLPNATEQGTTRNRNHYEEARSKCIAEIVELMKGGDGGGGSKVSLFQNVTGKRRKGPPSRMLCTGKPADPLASSSISDEHKKTILQKAQASSRISLAEKSELFYRLRIGCRSGGNMKRKLDQKLQTSSRAKQAAGRRLRRLVRNLSTNTRFRALQKWHNFNRCRTATVPFEGGLAKVFSGEPSDKKADPPAVEDHGAGKHVAPVKSFAQIESVLFCYGQYSHLVLVCTANRLLVWNLLSLKLQVSVALSIERIALDPFTNLIATFTKDNELYVFLPNIPMPLYHRVALPKVFGAVWVPRRYPRSQSFNVDWQATSQLFFLNEKQELLHLVSDNDEESLGPTSLCMNESMVGPNTPFAALLAKQSAGSSVQRTGASMRPGAIIGVTGKSAVKDIVSSSSHTMAPISLLCKDFLRSLLIVEEKRTKDTAAAAAKEAAHNNVQQQDGSSTNRADGFDSDFSDDASDAGDDDAVQQNGAVGLKEKIRARKVTLEVVQRAKQNYAAAADGSQDSKLRKILAEPFDIAFQ
ncbi:WD repeat-containing protein 75 [Anopheles cruzii]|uniref:WD repeat-containing protein 75 n=1 Tax=Anopheles cruzii TaxID=68878 RepID=UPI0022EC45F6|nr:WD repeat-containing protein 75 [Anopheles cruzii]